MKKLLFLFAVLLGSSIFGQKIIFRITNPTSIQGFIDHTNQGNGSGWGLVNLNNPADAVHDTVVLMDDGDTTINSAYGYNFPNSECGCDSAGVINSNIDFEGKIVLISRGTCQFGKKAYLAQLRGAVGVIIYNAFYDNSPGGGLMNMAGGDYGSNVSIPVAFISKNNAESLKGHINQGEVVKVFLGNKSGYYSNDVQITRALAPGESARPIFISQDSLSYKIPLKFWIKNDGSSNQNFISAKAEVFYNGVLLHSSIQDSISINSGDSTLADLSDFSKASYSSGKYEIIYNVGISNVSDECGYDNEKLYSVHLNNEIYCYSALDQSINPAQNIRVRPSSFSYWASAVQFTNPSLSPVLLNGVKFSGWAADGDSLKGKTLDIAVYQWNDSFTGLNDPAISTSTLLNNPILFETFQFSGNYQDSLVAHTFQNPIIIVPNQRYVIAIVSASSIYLTFSKEPIYEFNDAQNDAQPKDLLMVDGTWYPNGWTGYVPNIQLLLSYGSLVGCNDFYLSEYVEGSSNNKALEIYNPTSAAKSIAGYKLALYTNGATSTSNTFVFPSGTTIPAFGTYVIAHAQGTSGLLAVADTNYNYPNVVSFNGDDAVVFFDPNNDTIDIIGAVGVDPGTSWSVDSGSTSNFSLVRKSYVTSGQLDWSIGSTEWYVYPQNTFSNLGAHLSNCSFDTCSVETELTLSGSLSFCSGNSVTLTAASGQSYLWNTGDTTQSITSNQSGSYYAVVTNAYGCSDTTALYTTTLFADPDTSITISGSLSFCSGSSVTLTAASGQSYLWNTGDTTQSITSSQSGTYYAVVTNADGCSDTTALYTTTNSQTQVDAGADTTICLGESIFLNGHYPGEVVVGIDSILTILAPSGISGSYPSGIQGAGWGASSPVIDTLVVMDDGSIGFNTTYGYPFPQKHCGCDSAAVVSNTNLQGKVVLISRGTCEFGRKAYLAQLAGASGVIIYNAFPDTSGSGGLLTMAPGAFGSLVTIPMVFVSNGTGLMLKNRVPAPGSNPMVGTFVWSNGVQNGSSFTPIGNTTLYVTATDTNGCVSTDTINIFIHPSDSSITVSGSLAFCSGNSVTLTAASGQSYLWSNGDTTQSITINQSGSYYALVTTANGCIDTSSTRTTTVYPVADTTVTVTGSLSFCSGSSVTLTAANGQSFLWNTGDTTQSITSNQSGSYYAVVTNADGCSDTTAIYTTTLFADPINTVTASKTTLCVNDSALLSAYPGYSYLWNTNDTTQSITVHTSGNYFVSLTSSDGCSAISDTVIISVVPDATEIFGNDLVQPNSAQVYATQQNPGNTYSWVVTGGALVSGQNTNAISVLWGAAGNGQISVQENSGLCTYSDTLEVTISGIGVGESVLPESLIYPNPNNGLFTLEVAEALVGSEYELTDGLGRLIEKGKIESTSQDFDLLRKPKGVYRLSIKSTNGIKTMAVVVQ